MSNYKRDTEVRNYYSIRKNSKIPAIVPLKINTKSLYTKIKNGRTNFDLNSDHAPSVLLEK